MEAKRYALDEIVRQQRAADQKRKMDAEQRDQVTATSTIAVVQ
jgi:hypothetical protein